MHTRTCSRTRVHTHARTRESARLTSLLAVKLKGKHWHLNSDACVTSLQLAAAFLWNWLPEADPWRRLTHAPEPCGARTQHLDDREALGVCWTRPPALWDPASCHRGAHGRVAGQAGPCGDRSWTGHPRPSPPRRLAWALHPSPGTPASHGPASRTSSLPRTRHLRGRQRVPAPVTGHPSPPPSPLSPATCISVW